MSASPALPAAQADDGEISVARPSLLRDQKLTQRVFILLSHSCSEREAPSTRNGLGCIRRGGRERDPLESSVEFTAGVATAVLAPPAKLCGNVGSTPSILGFTPNGPDETDAAMPRDDGESYHAWMYVLPKGSVVPEGLDFVRDRDDSVSIVLTQPTHVRLPESSVDSAVFADCIAELAWHRLGRCTRRRGKDPPQWLQELPASCTSALRTIIDASDAPEMVAKALDVWNNHSPDPPASVLRQLCDLIDAFADSFQFQPEDVFFFEAHRAAFQVRGPRWS
jgi:hypothetical protein